MSSPTSSWRYRNPVEIVFGPGTFEQACEAVRGTRYGLVSYGDPPFRALAERLRETAGEPCLVIDDIAPNPDAVALRAQCARIGQLASPPDVLLALGGGSVIDSAKVLAAASGDFDRVWRYLTAPSADQVFTPIPLIAVPTTAGTGSEVTSWATVWDATDARKFSLNLPGLYPVRAIVDPELMLGKPRLLTISTGLDALSHAMESLWNVNANPVSARFAVAAARSIVEVLPRLADDLGNLELRTRMARAALFAGLAFSNTKTAIAHSLSYPITLLHGVQHGIACSFTLPMIMRSMAGTGGLCEDSLQEIFGAEADAGAARLDGFFARLGISTDASDYGVGEAEWSTLVDDALAGERGRNFVGSKAALLAASRASRRETVMT